LRPEPLLRCVVIIAGVAATVLGVTMILALSVPIAWRAAAAVVWLLMNTRELLVITNGYKRCQRIRMEHDGELAVLAPDGCWIGATLLAGSVVLSRFAWLRFESDDGQRFAELMREKRQKNKDWRRLQVIWRHLGAGG
ncbi:MAG: hypothetical protein OEU90_14975, partial [Gammaproteobacteria bacterium]|nr:hypothetical protein [Gammaproteobacteria bacterium]